MAEKPQLSFVSYPQGAYITVEGQLINKFFIIQNGIVRASNNSSFQFEKDKEMMLPGDFLGVLSAIAGRPQVETSKAEIDVQLITVNVSQFEGLIQYNNPVVIKILQQFSRQMRMVNNALTHIIIKSENKEEDTELLYRNAQYYAGKRDFEKAYYCYKRYIECYPSAQNTQKAAAEMKKMAQYNKPRYVVESNIIRRYNAGSLFCAEGESGGEMYVIQKGRANITKVVNGAEAMLAVLNTGDMFGEMALLETKPRSASAIAIEECTVMVITRKNFASMASSQPQLITRLTKTLADRIWYTYRLLSTVQIEGTVARFFYMLCLIMEKERVAMHSFINYSFNFTIDEIMNMAYIPQTDKKNIVNIISRYPSLILTDEKLFVYGVTEIPKLAEQYKRQYRLQRS